MRRTQRRPTATTDAGGTGGGPVADSARSGREPGAELPRRRPRAHRPATRARTSPSRRWSSARASRCAASTSTSTASTSCCWPCSRSRSAPPAEDLRAIGRRGGRRRSSASTASSSSTTGLCRPDPKGHASQEGRRRPAMAEFAQQLLTEHPKEAARAFAPLVSLFEEVLDEAAAAGVVRARALPQPDRRHRARGDHVQRLLLDHRRRRPTGDRASTPPRSSGTSSSTASRLNR